MLDKKKISPLAPHCQLDQPYTLWSRLYGSSQSLSMGRLARQHPAPLLVLVRDALRVQTIMQELAFYQGIAESSLYTFPDWETLPYDALSPYQDIISARLASLFYLPKLGQGIVVAPVSAALYRLLPCDYLLAHTLTLKVGDRLETGEFRRLLTECGYRIVSQVVEHGELAIRGGLIDLFPMGSEQPFRIDLFDDEVDGIRVFDRDNQRSLGERQAITILPAHEISLTEDGITRFRAAWRSRFTGQPSQSSIYQGVSQAHAPAGIEYYLPLFYPKTNTLFDYLPDRALVLLDQGVEEAVEEFWVDVEARYAQRQDDSDRPALPARELFLAKEDFYAQLKAFHQIRICSLDKRQNSALEYASALPPQLPINIRAADPLGVLKTFIEEYDGRILVVAEGVGRRETLLEVFAQHQLSASPVSNWDAFLNSELSFAITVAPLERGALLNDPQIAVISEAQLFGERVVPDRSRRQCRQDSEAIIKNLTELSIGAPVVHIDHGVGRYQGLSRLEVGGNVSEFITLEYASADRLYVPVAALDRVGRYTGADPEHAPLHKLGSPQWKKSVRKAREKIRDVAAELLEMGARRAAQTGQQLVCDEDAYRSFIQDFPFAETPHQSDAIAAVLQDMQQGKPMDRLICGDAGFGKTEIALRAAFIATYNGQQVALLVPTTLLAQQHYEKFKDRFSAWPVKVELLSRFRTRKAEKEVIDALRLGQVDIVIGTHKLLSKTTQFRHLGLLIIDEEHRFGVRQKEVFKSLRAGVDVLTLTATPIPRTLNMALSNLRELSIITTPPAHRQAVKTLVREWDSLLIKETILREFRRGGQVFFVHNEVKTIDNLASEVAALLPKAKIRVAHGQMAERELELIMLDFYHHRFDILVCTTIIETGIDVPAANTMIINRADKFGLAQLYQLRGRVGRSYHQAYAYLVIPPYKSLTPEAVKRLEAIESLEELGVGFTLATHDLEIRGAGDLLGQGQSGHIQEIGFGMYMELLDRTVQTLKAGHSLDLEGPLDQGSELNFHIPALIPDDFLPDVHMRLIMYKRIAGARDEQGLDALQEEMIDRFGSLPEPVKNLFQLAALKLRVHPLGIKKVDIGENGGRIHFGKQANIDLDKMIALIQSQPHRYRLDGQDRLRILIPLSDVQARFDMLRDLLDKIEHK